MAVYNKNGKIYNKYSYLNKCSTNKAKNKKKIKVSSQLHDNVHSQKNTNICKTLQ